METGKKDEYEKQFFNTNQQSGTKSGHSTIQAQSSSIYDNVA